MKISISTAKPTTNNLGNPIYQTPEEIKNFWKWFGKSKVRDSEGKPLVMYHGTDTSFDEFDLDTARKNRGSNVAGFYFTPDKWDADSYGSIVMQVYVKAEKPFITGKSKVNDSMAKKYAEVLLMYPGYGEHWINEVLVPEFKKYAKFKDIDGKLKMDVIQAGGYDSYFDGRHVVVFDNMQIRPVG